MNTESLKRWAINLGLMFTVGALASLGQAVESGNISKASISTAVAAGIASIVTLLRQSPIPPKQ